MEDIISTLKTSVGIIASRMEQNVEACKGESCPQYKQLSVQQKIFASVSLTFLTILIGISTYSFFQISSYSEKADNEIHDIRVLSTTTSEHVKRMESDLLVLKTDSRDTWKGLFDFKLDVERRFKSIQ